MPSLWKEERITGWMEALMENSPHTFKSVIAIERYIFWNYSMFVLLEQMKAQKLRFHVIIPLRREGILIRQFAVFFRVFPPISYIISIVA
jgi:hypothetical protein